MFSQINALNKEISELRKMNSLLLTTQRDMREEIFTLKSMMKKSYESSESSGSFEFS